MLGTHWEQQNPKGSTTPTTTAPFKIKKMGSIGPLGACSTPSLVEDNFYSQLCSSHVLT